MNIGDLVRVASMEHAHHGEIGIITKRLNNYFIYAMIPSGEFMFIHGSLEAL